MPPSAASAAAAPAAAATLALAEGSVELISPSGSTAAKPPVALDPGARVKTGPRSSALLILDNGSKLLVGEKSDFKLEARTESGYSVSLLRGALNCWIRNLGARRLRVRTPGAVAAVRGTVFDAVTDGTLSHFDLYKGEIVVTDSFGRGTILSPGQRATVSLTSGLRGTVSLPPGARAPAEPVGAVSAAVSAADRTPPPPVSILTLPPVSILPPPPPQQQINVVSPSSP